MKTIVVILVYDRYENLKHWLECWQKRDHGDAELLVIHNNEGSWEYEQNKFFRLCVAHEIGYIPRSNIGYDIGALQDVCLNRLPGFPDFDNLLWLTDDCFPMSKDFVKQFNNAMTPGIGVVAMEISHSVRTHIRTSAFMVSKEVCQRLTFPADPIITKRECYEFEHTSNNTFLRQVKVMGLKVVEVSDRQTCPLWDSGYPKKLNRQKEHELIFGPMPEQPEYVPKRFYL